MITLPADTETDLQHLVPRGAVAGARRIGRLDADFLTPAERADRGPAVAKALHASGAARAVARQLLASLGYAPCDIRRGPGGAPIWPRGVVGSLSHCSNIAVAAVARATEIEALGIDIEPAEGIEPELARMVLTGREATMAGNDPLHAHTCFAIKEAIYKAVFPRDGVFLDFHDVELDFHSRKATTTYGRTVSWSCSVSESILAVAWVSRDPAHANAAASSTT